MAIVQCGAVVWADVNRERGGASGGSAMCLDAAVMGTCPTFINQSRGRREGGRGKKETVCGEMGGGRGCRVSRRRRGKRGRKGVLAGGVGEVTVGGGGVNKAHIDVLNTAAGVS